MTVVGNRAPIPLRTDHVQALHRALDNLGDAAEQADAWGRTLAPVLLRGGRLFAAGNGGSAAQAQHLTAEIVGRYRDDRRPFSALSLHGDASSLTAITNDYGPDEAFARQLEAHCRPGDVVVLMSTSGGSPNVLAAARRARRCGVHSWAMTGPAPNALAMQVDAVVSVDSPHTATVQETHLVLLHLLCAGLDDALAGMTP